VIAFSDLRYLISGIIALSWARKEYFFFPLSRFSKGKKRPRNLDLL
jgi:hypothetical protein